MMWVKSFREGRHSVKLVAHELSTCWGLVKAQNSYEAIQMQLKNEDLCRYK